MYENMIPDKVNKYKYLPVLIISMLMVNIEWLLDESAFISVAPTDLFFHPFSINCSHSAVLVTV